MTSPLLLTFGESLGTRQAVTDILDEIPEVTYWFAPFPHGLLLTSTLSAHELARRIEKLIPAAVYGKWIITPVDPDEAQGRLPKKGWHLIHNPESPRLPRKKASD